MPALEHLPKPSARRLATRLTPDAGRQVMSGHPWVYADSITSLSHEGAPGDLAVIFDSDRAFMAIGLYDPASPIRIKVLHRGKPATIDGEFWRRRLAAALAIREPLVERGDTTGYRCVNGENDGFPGLVLDRYADTFVLKIYSAMWVPHLAALAQVIDDALHPASMVLRCARSIDVRDLHGLEEGDALLGLPPDGPVLFQEHGLWFEADVVGGQKTGHFLDQRDNRALAGSYAKGARVLDVFCATGGFTVHTAAGGATAVVSVDLSEPTLAVVDRNLAHNRHLPAVAAMHHSAIAGDAFEVMDRLARARERFDMVIVDPPSFAQRQSSVDRALHAYGQLTERAVKLLRPGGLLVQASCSSRVQPNEFFATVRASTLRADRTPTELRRTGHPIDHPIGFAQGEYLKAWFARID